MWQSKMRIVIHRSKGTLPQLIVMRIFQCLLQQPLIIIMFYCRYYESRYTVGVWLRMSSFYWTLVAIDLAYLAHCMSKCPRWAFRFFQDTWICVADIQPHRRYVKPYIVSSVLEGLFGWGMLVLLLLILQGCKLCYIWPTYLCWWCCSSVGEFGSHCHIPW